MDCLQVVEALKRRDPIPEHQIRQICKQLTELLMGERNVLTLTSPINVVGDVHGQYYDVLKLFALGTSDATQAESFPIPSIFSLETMLTADTTLSKPFSF